MGEWERRPGRRKLPSRRRREHIIEVRLSLEELDRIAPRLEGSPLSTWIRQAALDRAQKSEPPRSDPHP